MSTPTPTHVREAIMRDVMTTAQEAIGLFLEYRDKHGYPEDEARSRAIAEVHAGFTAILDERAEDVS